MLRPPLLAAVAVATVLGCAGPAAAKQVVAVSACGAHGCVDRTPLMGRQHADSGLLDLGTVRVAEPQAAPFVRLKLHIGDGSGQAFGQTTVLLLPRTGLAASEDGSWWLVPRAQLRTLRRLVRGVPRIPAAELAFPSASGSGEASAASDADVVAPPHREAARGNGGGASGGAIAGAGAAILTLVGGGVVAVARRRRRDHAALGEAPAAG